MKYSSIVCLPNVLTGSRFLRTFDKLWMHAVSKGERSVRVARDDSRGLR